MHWIVRLRSRPMTDRDCAFLSQGILIETREAVGRQRNEVNWARSSGAHFQPKPFLDPLLYHSLIFRLPLLLSNRFQLLHEPAWQAHGVWSMPSCARHGFIEVLWPHPMILGLGFLLFPF